MRKARKKCRQRYGYSTKSISILYLRRLSVVALLMKAAQPSTASSCGDWNQSNHGREAEASRVYDAWSFFDAPIVEKPLTNCRSQVSAGFINRSEQKLTKIDRVKQRKVAFRDEYGINEWTVFMSHDVLIKMNFQRYSVSFGSWPYCSKEICSSTLTLLHRLSFSKKGCCAARHHHDRKHWCHTLRKLDRLSNQRISSSK